MMSSSTENVSLDKSRQSNDCKGTDNTDTIGKSVIATNSNDDIDKFDRYNALQSNSIGRNKCATKNNLASQSSGGPISSPASAQLAQVQTKTPILSTSLEAATAAKTPTSSVASPSSSPSMATTTAKDSHLVNSDSGIDSGAADVSPNFSKEQLTNQLSTNAVNKRSNSAHQAANGSLSDSLTSTEGNRTPNVENLSKTNLYIRGLPSSTTDEDLYNMCAKFGNILSTKAIFDKTTGCCRGYGFVQYTAPQSAELAVSELTKTGIQAQMARIPSPYPSLNYAHHHHHHQLQQHQHQHHNHNHSQHHHYNQNNGSRGNYNIGNMNANNQLLNSSNNLHNSNQNNADPTNLYIANLPPNMSEHELELLLSNYGPVVSTRILRDERNNPRGVGFARMESRDKCQEIIEKLNGKSCKGSQEPLLVKFADGGNRKRHNHNHHHHHNNNHHHQHHHHKLNQDDNRWRESGSTSDPNSMSGFEQHGNIPHNNQMSDLSMLGALGYPRIQASYTQNMAPSAGYPTTLGPPTSAHQWLQPGPAQQWNVIPQQMIQPGGPGSSNQAGASTPFPYGHIPQLTSQMQGLQITHHSGGPIGGYLQPHHQWPPIWPHPIPSQHHQASVRLSNPLPPSAASQQQQPVLESSEGAKPFISGQEVAQDLQSKQTSVGETGNQIQVSAPM